MKKLLKAYNHPEYDPNYGNMVILLKSGFYSEISTGP